MEFENYAWVFPLKFNTIYQLCPQNGVVIIQSEIIQSPQGFCMTGSNFFPVFLCKMLHFIKVKTK